jgi:hypothetical protein
VVAVPTSIVNRLRFRLRAFVIEGLRVRRVEFIENAVSDVWNTRYSVHRPNRAGKGGRPRYTKHCRQK